MLNQSEYSGTNLVLRHAHDVVDVLLYNLEGVYARFFYGNAVGNGQHVGERFDLVMVNAVQHTGCSFSLHTYYAYRGLERLYGISHATGQTATANGYKDNVDVRIFV